MLHVTTQNIGQAALARSSGLLLLVQRVTHPVFGVAGSITGDGSLLPTFPPGQTGGGDPPPSMGLADIRDSAKQELLRGVDTLPQFP